MNNESSTKKFFRWFWIPLLVIIAVAVAVNAFLKSPLSPTHMCTLIGCRDYLELTLSHEPPQEYIVQVTSGSGDTMSVTCAPGSINATAPLSPTCQAGKVLFYEFAPQEVTIKITWQGGSYTLTGRPTYTTFMPNGPDCPPECRKGSMQVEIP